MKFQQIITFKKKNKTENLIELLSVGCQWLSMSVETVKESQWSSKILDKRKLKESPNSCDSCQDFSSFLGTLLKILTVYLTFF